MSFLDAIDPKRGGIGAALRSNLLANEKYIQESDVEMKAATERAKEKSAKIDAEEAKLDPNVLTPPKLEKWTAPPQTSPLEAFGSSAGVLASLGGLLTRRPLTASLNAAAGVLDAYKRKDAAAAQTAFDEWKINTENAVKLAHFELDAYRAALSKIDTDRAGTYAEVRNLTAVFQNHTANQILVTQGLDGIAKYENDMRVHADKIPEQQLKILEYKTMKDELDARDADKAARANTANPMSNEEFVNTTNRILSKQPAPQPTGKWDVYTDPEHVGPDGKTVPAKQYVMHSNTAETRDLAGKPYTPTGAVKGAGSTITEETRDLMAEQYLAGDKSVFVGVGRGAQGAENIAALRETIRRKAEEKGMSGSDIAIKMAEFSGLMAGERVLGGRIAQAGMAVNEAKQLIPLALEASEKVDRTEYPTLNKLIIAYDKGTGDTNVIRMGAAFNGLVNIYARAINPSAVPTISDKDHVREVLELAFSKGQVRAGIDQITQEMDAAARSPAATMEDFRQRYASGGSIAPPSGGSPPAAGVIRYDSQGNRIP
jgi:hypothetical protein